MARHIRGAAAQDPSVSGQVRSWAVSNATLLMRSEPADTPGIGPNSRDLEWHRVSLPCCETLWRFSHGTSIVTTHQLPERTPQATPLMLNILLNATGLSQADLAGVLGLNAALVGDW